MKLNGGIFTLCRVQRDGDGDIASWFYKDDVGVELVIFND